MENKIISFFNIEDIIHLSKYAGKTYRSANREDVRIGKEIAEKLTAKTAYWVEKCLFDDFVAEPSYHWQVMGQFARYTWARMYRKGHEKNGVYFTVGVDFDLRALVYKLDCQHTVPNRSAKGKIVLTEQQKSDFYDIVSETEAEWNQIDIDEIKTMDWDGLIARTTKFIKKHEFLYDRAVNVVWHAAKKYKIENDLELTDAPNGALSESDAKSRRQYHGKPDYDKQRTNQKRIGDIGEEIVYKLEIKKLNKIGLAHLSRKVKHISKEDDAAGYDIYSFDENGKEIFIEVKSTLGYANKPWFVSRAELEFSKSNANNYILYRVYDLDLNVHKGKYFKLYGALDKSISLEPIIFEAKVRGN